LNLRRTPEKTASVVGEFGARISHADLWRKKIEMSLLHGADGERSIKEGESKSDPESNPYNSREMTRDDRQGRRRRKKKS